MNVCFLAFMHLTTVRYNTIKIELIFNNNRTRFSFRKGSANAQDSRYLLLNIWKIKLMVCKSKKNLTPILTPTPVRKKFPTPTPTPSESGRVSDSGAGLYCGPLLNQSRITFRKIRTSTGLSFSWATTWRERDHASLRSYKKCAELCGSILKKMNRLH